MVRPVFNAAWAASQRISAPVNQGAKVAALIGGTVAKNIALTPPLGWKNTCAVRMSYILNQSGMPVPRIPGKTVSGDDKKWYFYRVKDLIDFLTNAGERQTLSCPSQWRAARIWLTSEV